jgi:hypothetical protein
VKLEVASYFLLRISSSLFYLLTSDFRKLTEKFGDRSINKIDLFDIQDAGSGGIGYDWQTDPHHIGCHGIVGDIFNTDKIQGDILAEAGLCLKPVHKGGILLKEGNGFQFFK